MKVLYLEDDLELSQTVEELLTQEHYHVTVAHCANEVFDFTYKDTFDIFIFDVNLPDINGFELLKSLRETGIETAAIFTTSLEGIESLSQAYLAGADDYLLKPFFMDELLFRIKAILKREFKSKNAIINITHSISFNINTNQLRKERELITLNLKESSLLKLLIKHKNECVNFETIYQTLWAYNEEYSDVSLRTYIKKLRQYIAKENIVSIKKVGYKLIIT